MNAQNFPRNAVHATARKQALRPAIARADFIAGMAKGMAVLESFDTERQRLNASLTAQRTGITRAAARRHLLTLAHLGYLETDGHFYWLSSKVLRFSGSYLASARLPRILQPTLNRLSMQSGESFSAVVRDNNEVVIIAKSYKNYSNISNKNMDYLPYGLHLGARLPLHATSTGRVLLAALGEAEFEAWLVDRPLPRLTMYTCTDIQQFRQLIADIKRTDYALAQQEHELGVHALAVPVRNMVGKTVAALNVVTQPERLEQPVLQRDLLPLLQDAARELQALV